MQVRTRRTPYAGHSREARNYEFSGAGLGGLRLSASCCANSQDDKEFDATRLPMMSRSIFLVSAISWSQLGHNATWISVVHWNAACPSGAGCVAGDREAEGVSEEGDGGVWRVADKRKGQHESAVPSVSTAE